MDNKKISFVCFFVVCLCIITRERGPVSCYLVSTLTSILQLSSSSVNWRGIMTPFLIPEMFTCPYL